MSVRARQILAVSVLAIVLAVTAARSGSTLLAGTAPDAFPADVAVTASPAPNIYADKPDVRVHQLIASMNLMWSQAFTAADDEYTEPGVGSGTSDCGKGTSGWAGLYCPAEKRILIDLDDHLVRRAAVGDERSDDLLGYVLAHEVGHHVQAERGLGAFSDPDDIVKAELHAQCLAGVWGRAAGRPLPPETSYVPDANHGSVADQVRWLNAGHAAGRPAACDAVWGE